MEIGAQNCFTIRSRIDHCAKLIPVGYDKSTLPLVSCLNESGEKLRLIAVPTHKWLIGLITHSFWVIN